MSKKYLIKNAGIVNESKIAKGNVLIENGIISKITFNNSIPENKDTTVINAEGRYLLPGIIDTHVHFREPGLTAKADIYSESKAAVAGGVTSFFDMPNTVPNATTGKLLEEKVKIAEKKSFADFSFFIGAANDNIDELLKADKRKVCGIKVFMGSSTGNMLVDKEDSLKEIFSISGIPVACHCEDEEIIRTNTKYYKDKYGANIPVVCHPLIRNEEACYKAAAKAVDMAGKYNTRLHLLHVSTAKEIQLLENSLPLEQKKITSEVCVHHLWFSDNDYKRLGTKIKCNPAIKTGKDRQSLLEALLNDRIDIVSTDHAPHTVQEKHNCYFDAPSGIPLVQHSLVAMLELYHKKIISLEKIVEKMCHAPAICYKVEKKGFIKEGFHADLVIADLNTEWEVNKSNILYKCLWSPFEEDIFHSKVTHTFVNGNLVFENGKFDESVKGRQIIFNR